LSIWYGYSDHTSVALAVKDNPAMQKLAASMNSYKLKFSVFVGDTKSGSTKCDDGSIPRTKDLFKLQQVQQQTIITHIRALVDHNATDLRLHAINSTVHFTYTHTVSISVRHW
jgi:hypothetical protein